MTQERDIRAVLAEVALSTWHEAHRLGGIPQKLPNGHGFVVVEPDPARMPDYWTVRDTSITVAKLREASELIEREGLGAVAQVTWQEASCDGTAWAWAPGPEAAVRALRTVVLSRWPARRAVGTLMKLEPWRPGERREDENGLAITAPISTMPWPRATLLRLDGDAGIALSVDGSDWSATLIEALASPPTGAVEGLLSWYNGKGWPDEDGRDAARGAAGLIRPAGPLTDHPRWLSPTPGSGAVPSRRTSRRRAAETPDRGASRAPKQIPGFM